MDGTERQIKSEVSGRLVCCVCDTRKCVVNPDYLCSRSCEKLFVLMQGIVIGNILQSIFRDLIEVEKIRSESKEIQRSELDIQEDQSVKDCQSIDSHSPSCHEVDEHSSIGLGDFSEAKITADNNQEYGTLVCNGVADPVAPSDRTDLFPVVTVDSVKPDKIETGLSLHLNTRRNDRLKRTCTSNRRKSSDKQHLSSVKKNKSIKRPARFNSIDDPSNSRPTVIKEEVCGNEQGQGLSVAGCGNNGEKTDIQKRISQRTKCKQCGQMISKSFLYVHYRAKHKDQLEDISVSSMSCSECGKLFMRKQALNTHKLKRHNHKFTNNCNHCGKGFASRFGLSWHMRQVHKITGRQCGTCGETFENRQEYKKHRRFKHSTNSHVCHICGKGFKLKNALQAHLDAHAGVKLHFCEICGDGFVRFSSLCQHKNNLHGPKKSELPFKCHLCPNTFRLQTWLVKHIQQKHESTGRNREVNADCKVCQDQAADCALHGKTSKETFSCQQCEKSFAKETSLKAHMKQHQEPKFTCDICHKKFTYKCNMLRHRDTHKKEKSFHCDVCAKKFCTKFLLASHMRMHNRDLLFKCEICGKGLTRKDYLKNHVMKMHPDCSHAYTIRQQKIQNIE